MSVIKYIDEQGEHNGSLTIGEYLHFGVDETIPTNYRTPYGSVTTANTAFLRGQLARSIRHKRIKLGFVKGKEIT